MHNTENDILMARKIAEKVKEKSGTTYYVGGYVRDSLTNRENNDIDIEIHGLHPKELEDILDSLGERISIGESFGIYNLKGYSLDIVMPRKETVISKGHNNFEDFVDPFAGEYSAAKRRDFTINAIMKNVLTDELVDLFDGEKDLAKGIIRHINNETFIEDPLRVLRAAQFAARFNFEIAEETIELCKNIKLNNISHERVEAELVKALLKSEKPSVFFESLRKMDKLDEWFIELKNIINIDQPVKYHSEGDVWTHTMMVIDAAANYRNKVNYPAGYMLAAVTHDFGKAVSTQIINGQIHAYDHDIAGIPIIKQFLNRITKETRLKRYVLNMAEMHMRPNILANNNSSVKASNKLFDCSVEPLDLIYLAAADDEGRITTEASVSYTDFLLDRLNTFNSIMEKPYVMGKDLIAAGLKPDKNFTTILEHAHKLRLAGIEKDNALKQTLAFAKKLQ